MASLLTSLRTKYNTFSKTQKNIADYILANPENTTLMSITDLARQCGTSEPTVMRLLKKLDYNSYQVFRINLAKELSENPTESINEELSQSDDLSTIKQKVIGHTITAIRDIEMSLTDEVLAKAINLLTGAKKILIFGVGASAAISEDAFHKFGNIGMNVFSYPDPHLMNIIASHTKKGDLFIGISHTGESLEVLKAGSIAKDAGAKILGLTSYSNSSLANLSDLYLLSATNEKKYHSEAMASRIVQLALIDILYVAIFMENEGHYYDELTQSRIAVSLNKT